MLHFIIKDIFLVWVLIAVIMIVKLSLDLQIIQSINDLVFV